LSRSRAPPMRRPRDCCSRLRRERASTRATGRLPVPPLQRGPTIILMRFAAVIFDMDGLTLDTERVYRDIFNRAAADCKIEFPDWLHLKLLGRNTVDMKRILREFLGEDALFEQYLERNRHHHGICFADA